MPDELPKTPTDVFSNLTPTMDAARGAIARVGLRMYRVYLVTDRWDPDGEVGEGEPIGRTFEELLPTPQVRFLSAARIASSGGTYHEGAVELSKVSRARRREELLGLTLYGDRRPRSERFSIGLVPKGQLLIELYNPASEPVLRPLEWRMVLNPINRRFAAPDIDP